MWTYNGSHKRHVICRAGLFNEYPKYQDSRKLSRCVQAEQTVWLNRRVRKPPMDISANLRRKSGDARTPSQPMAGEGVSLRQSSSNELHLSREHSSEDQETNVLTAANYRMLHALQEVLRTQQPPTAVPKSPKLGAMPSPTEDLTQGETTDKPFGDLKVHDFRVAVRDIPLRQVYEQAPSKHYR